MVQAAVQAQATVVQAQAAVQAHIGTRDSGFARVAFAAQGVQVVAQVVEGWPGGGQVVEGWPGGGPATLHLPPSTLPSVVPPWPMVRPGGGESMDRPPFLLLWSKVRIETHDYHCCALAL